MKFLIAEDDRTSAFILESAMKRKGYDYLIVSNGREALNRVKQESFDVVLTDWMMPEVDGITLIREIRKLANRHPLIVMVTSLASIESKAHAMDSGADEFMAKPFNPTKIFEAVNKLINRRDQIAPKTPIVSSSVVASIVAPPYVGVVVTASTGGPVALKTLLKNLPPIVDESVIFIVQHGPKWMLEALADSLHRSTTRNVSLAENGCYPEPGQILIAPGEKHLCIASEKGCGIKIDDGPEENYVKPSADPLFRTAAMAFGPFCLGVVLTGLGRDGSLGATALKAAGGKILVQDPATAVAAGMPSSVISVGAVDEILKIEQMTPAIDKQLRNMNQRLKAKVHMSGAR